MKSKWKKRVRTGVLRWRDRDRFYGFTNIVEAGHVGPIIIDYVHDGVVRNRRLFPQVNLATMQAEAFQP